MPLRNRILILALAFCASLPAQDCSFGTNFTTTGTSTPFYNLVSGGCVFWNVTATVSGFSGFSVTFQGAADSSGSPGSFSTVGGVTAGANPIVANNTTLSTDEYHDWLRMDLTSATGTGTVVINAYGYRQGSGTAAGSAGAIQLTNGSGLFQASNGFLATFATVGAAQYKELSANLNDLSSGGTFTDWKANAGTTFSIVISATGTPDHFTWQKNNGSVSAPVAITGAAQTLSDGVTATFAATTGHTLNDMWIIPIEDHIALPNQTVNSGCGSGYGDNGIACATVYFDSGANTTSILDSANNSVLLSVAQNSGLSKWIGQTRQMVGIGWDAFGGLQTGCARSVAIGIGAGPNCNGAFNTYLGTLAGFDNAGGSSSAGSNNTFLGAGSASSGPLTGSNNTAVGMDTMANMTSGASNTALGASAGTNNQTGSGNVFLGAFAGAQATSSNEFYLGNVQQSNPTNDRKYSLLYGTFSGSAGSLTNQQLTVNGNVTYAEQLTSAGYAFASLPSATNGTIVYCQDCDAGILGGACTSAGTKTGNIAVRLNGAWRCLD